MSKTKAYLRKFDNNLKRQWLPAALKMIREKGFTEIGVPNCKCCAHFPNKIWEEHFRVSWGLVAEFQAEDENHKHFKLAIGH